jgi:glycosyltransferase involved in cell wall biosynthesis
LISNCQGLSENDKLYLNKTVVTKEIRILSTVELEVRIQKICGNVKRKILAGCLLLLDLVIQIYNGFLILVTLKSIKPNTSIVFNGGYPAAHSCQTFIILSKSLKIDTYLSVVSMATPRRKFLAWLENFFDKIVWNSCSAIITNCDAVGNSLINLRSLSVSKRKHTIYNGLIDSHILSKQIKSVNKLKFIIGFVSRIEESKGIFILLEAFGRLFKIFPNIELHVYGEGSASLQVEERIRVFSSPDSIVMHGYQGTEISIAYSEFDVFAFPSLWEGLPYSILEAMRSGLPIVATNVGGINEAINDYKNGILVPPGSVDSLVEGLSKIIVNHELALTFGYNARNTYLNNFSYEKLRSTAILFADKYLS